MSMRPLDIDAVQAFRLVADLKSFTRAAEVMETTQSVVSIKIKKLEAQLGRRLFERTPRLVRLSADGGAFLDPARTLIEAHQRAINAFDVEQRRLIVGISHHIVGAELPALLKRLGRVEPQVVLELQVATSRDVLDQFDSGALDAALVLRNEDRRDGETILEETFGWMAAPDFEHRPGDPLRLASQSEKCSVRTTATALLDARGIVWTEVFVGGGVATIGAAVSAGLAVAALSRRVAPVGTIDIGPSLGLPPLPNRDVVLYVNTTDDNARSALRTLVAAMRSTAL